MSWDSEDKIIKLQFHKDFGPIVIRQSTYLTYIAPHIQTFSLLFKDINFFLIHSFKLFCLFFMTAQLESLTKTEPERFHTGLSSSLHWENVWIIMVQYPQRVLTWADFRELTELKRTVVALAQLFVIHQNFCGVNTTVASLLF